jgi:hypothetical protein
MAIFTAALGVSLPGFIQMLVAAAASFAVGVLPHASALPVAAVVAAGAAAALLSFTTLIPPARRRSR